LVALLPKGFLRRKIISGQTLRIFAPPKTANRTCVFSMG
jgi:hypothetical protein